MSEISEKKHTEVIQILGDGRYKLKCSDGIDRIGLARGLVRRRLWIKESDKVIIQLRDIEFNKCDIISKIMS